MDAKRGEEKMRVKEDKERKRIRKVRRRKKRGTSKMKNA